MSQLLFCKDCRRHLREEEFPRNRARPQGRAFYCRPCGSARTQLWKRDNPEKVAAQRARHRLRAAQAPAYV